MQGTPEKYKKSVQDISRVNVGGEENYFLSSCYFDLTAGLRYSQLKWSLLSSAKISQDTVRRLAW